MKFRVEIELSEAEVPVATELLQVIRLLTDHVKGSSLVVNGVASGSQPPAGPAAAPAAVPVPVPMPAAAPPAAPAPAPAPAAPPAALPLRDQIRNVLLRVAPDGGNTDQVAQELAAAIEPVHQQHAANPEDFTRRILPEEFAEAFVSVAFDPALLTARRGSAAFVRTVASMPEAYKTLVAPQVVRKTLAQVTKKRPEDAPREGYTLQAEAFATLAALGLVANFEGALVSMDRVLKKPENRAAAIDTLCYIMQQSEAKVASSSPAALQSLLASVESVTDPRWGNEVAFLRSKLHALVGPAAAPPAAAPAAGPPQQQGPPVQGPPVPVPVPVPSAGPAAAAASPVPASANLFTTASVPLSGGAIFSLCYEASKQQLIVGGKDAPLTVVGPSGEVVQQFPHPNQFVCAIDTFPQHNMALASLSNVPNTGTDTGIAIYDTNPWGVRATISRPGTDMLACLRCLPGSNTFVTAESFKATAGQPAAEVVCMYDLGTALAAGVNAQPLRVWSEHTDLVSCLSAVPGQPNLFVSGSRDLSIKLWDTRMERSAGVLKSAHTLMVTCIDGAANDDMMLASSSLDCTLSVWDLRRLASSPEADPLLTVQVDGSAVLKVALADAPYPRLAAVATTSGIYGLDLQPADGGYSITRVLTANLAADLTHRQFNDIRWGRHQGKSVLFAACSDRPRVDVIELVA